MAFDWTEEKVALLLQYRKEGLSYAEVGRKLGCSREACIGKFKRLEGYKRPYDDSQKTYEMRKRPRGNKKGTKLHAGHSLIEPWVVFRARKVAERAAAKAKAASYNPQSDPQTSEK